MTMSQSALKGSSLIGWTYFHTPKLPIFHILIILFLPRHSPITLNLSRYQTEMHRLPIPDIADLDKLNSGNIITFPLLSIPFFFNITLHFFPLRFPFLFSLSLIPIKTL